jgi:hypothetical protein
MQKINMNQGFFAYYRGLNAMFLKLASNYCLRYITFNHFETALENTVLASVAAASFNTLLTYPLDLAQGRMQGDMSKKPSLFVAETSKASQFNKP